MPWKYRYSKSGIFDYIKGPQPFW